MPTKVVSRALKARLAFQHKLGRLVQISEVASAIGASRSTLTNLEQEKTSAIDFDLLALLCDYYGCEITDILQRVEITQEEAEQIKVKRHQTAQKRQIRKPPRKQYTSDFEYIEVDKDNS